MAECLHGDVYIAATIRIIQKELVECRLKLRSKKGFSADIKKIENCTILIRKGNSYCRRKSSARGPWFKVSFEGLDYI